MHSFMFPGLCPTRPRGLRAYARATVPTRRTFEFYGFRPRDNVRRTEIFPSAVCVSLRVLRGTPNIWRKQWQRPCTSCTLTQDWNLPESGGGKQRGQQAFPV